MLRFLIWSGYGVHIEKYPERKPKRESGLAAAAAAAAAKLLQSCLTLCDPIDGSPPGSTVPGILQARTLEWIAISFSNAWKGKVKVKSLSRVRLFSTPWTVAHQAPPSMGFSRQEYWSGLPLPSPNRALSTKQNKFLLIYRQWESKNISLKCRWLMMPRKPFKTGSL